MKYLCIDLKSFYASVECIERGLDPITTPLAVCDLERGVGSLFLAATPAVKKMGLKSRSRLFEIPEYLKKQIIFAKPRMKKYIEYSAKVYEVYLEMFSADDIYSYSIDEVFIDVTPYITYYNMSIEDLSLEVVKRVYNKTKLICCVGSGDNMLLAKLSLDILAKKEPNGVYYLNIEKFKERIWMHEPITDIWRIGAGTQKRLYKYGIKTLGQLANSKKELILKEFGVIGEELYEHAWGIDTTTIKEIKDYIPINKSLNNSRILCDDVDKEGAIVVLLEIADTLLLKLIEGKLKTNNIGIDIGYSRILNLSFHKSLKLTSSTNSYKIISNEIKDVVNNYVDNLPIRKLGLTFGGLSASKVHQLSLFEEDNEEEVKLYETIKEVKDRFGKNALNKAISHTEEGTQRKRNEYIGGHNSE